jgi:hypothetical protein
MSCQVMFQNLQIKYLFASEALDERRHLIYAVHQCIYSQFLAGLLTALGINLHL